MKARKDKYYYKKMSCSLCGKFPRVFAKIADLFSTKLYNLNSLTVGPTEDITMSRTTISVLCDDATFEQIKKQLNRFIEIIILFSNK
ncbi:ACT domain-containing protein [Terrisporobacter glycolicus]|uniref:ACT domain-containing protein n=1 Tax=Terrisporobacter glycolicus TaxID=36841 RepID=UPI000A599802